MATLRRSATTTARPPAALPADVRLMNSVSAFIFAAAAVGAAAAAVVAVSKSALFPIRGVQLEGEIALAHLGTVRASAAPRLAGNFFSVDLQAGRAAFEAVPWVRRAVVRRVWPDRLAVRLEEHRAVALWSSDDSSDRLVNSHGEVFDANIGDVEDSSLPSFSGPDGSAASMLALYQRLQPVMAGIQLELVHLHLSGRGSWRAEFDSGAAVELGRGTLDEIVARSERFARTLPQATARWRAPLEYADLRHADAYALRLRGVSTTSAAAIAAAAKTP